MGAPAEAGHYKAATHQGTTTTEGAPQALKGVGYQRSAGAQARGDPGGDGTAQATAMAEAYDHRIFGGPFTESSSCHSAAWASKTITREWEEDPGADNDPPDDIAASASGTASSSFAVVCGATQGCSASCTLGSYSLTDLSGEGQDSLAEAPGPGRPRGGSFPTDDDPPKLGNSDAVSDAFSVSTVLTGAASVSVTVSCAAEALAERRSNEDQDPPTDNAGAAASGDALAEL